MAEEAGKLILNDEQIESLAAVQNRLIRSLVDGIKAFDPFKASWDKVTWGRKSSQVSNLGYPIEMADELEVSFDPRRIRE